MSDRDLMISDEIDDDALDDLPADDMSAIEFVPEPASQKRINKRSRADSSVQASRSRSTGYRHQDNHNPRRINNKPSRELESMLHDTSPPLKTLPDGQGRFVGYNLPKKIIDRFEDMGFKLHFFVYGTGINEYTGYGWRPVMLSEVPEIAMAIIPIPGLFKEELREYFIYRDHILMKIHHDDWAIYERDWLDRMKHNDSVMIDAAEREEAMPRYRRKNSNRRGIHQSRADSMPY